MRKASIIIPTRNRSKYWKKVEQNFNFSLLGCLYNQTNKNFEVLIIDDNSEDDTILFLVEFFRKNPPDFEVRLFKTNFPNHPITQASSAADNVGFKNASYETLIHLDDDVLIDEALVEFALSLEVDKYFSVYFGEIAFINEEGIIIDGDVRLKLLHKDKNPENGPVLLQISDTDLVKVRLNPEENLAWGALYVAPLSVIRSIGGHDLRTIYWRGGDATLGRRLATIIPAYFVSCKELKCYHFGLSWYRKNVKEKQFGFIEEYQLSIPDSIIVNGGLSFWSSSWFKEEEIKIFE